MPRKENCSAPDSAEGTDCVDFDKEEGIQDEHFRGSSWKDEAVRLRTFADWPISVPVRPEDLAREGFFYLNSGDKVKCAFCNLILKSWEQGDDVRREHAKFNRNCPFLLGTNVGNKPLGIVEMRKAPPMFPEYSKFAAREASFSTMQKSIQQTPEQLAQAGFFYTGTADYVTCFCCGLNLRNWDPEDEPWAEHKHWYPTCEFLKTQPPPDEYRCEVTPVVRKCLDMGFEENIVMNAVSRKRRSGAGEYEDVSALVDAVEKLRVQQETSKRVHARGSSIKKKRKENAAASGPSSGTCETSGASSIEDEYLQMKEQRLCKICMEAEVEVVFIPCGHFVCCENCAHKLRECPMCRQKIRTVVRTYMA